MLDSFTLAPNSAALFSCFNSCVNNLIIDMLRLENWFDLFKFNKTLMEDDYNAGQQLVVKSKTGNPQQAVRIGVIEPFPGVELHFQAEQAGSCRPI